MLAPDVLCHIGGYGGLFTMATMQRVCTLWNAALLVRLDVELFRVGFGDVHRPLVDVAGGLPENPEHVVVAPAPLRSVSRSTSLRTDVLIYLLADSLARGQAVPRTLVVHWNHRAVFDDAPRAGEFVRLLADHLGRPDCRMDSLDLDLGRCAPLNQDTMQTLLAALWTRESCHRFRFRFRVSPTYYPSWCCSLLSWALWKPHNRLTDLELALEDEATTQMVLREVLWAYADHTNDSVERLRLVLHVSDNTAPMIWGLVRTIGRLRRLRALSLCVIGSLRHLTPTSAPSRGVLDLEDLTLDLSRTGITPTGLRVLLQGLHGARRLRLDVQGNDLSPWLGMHLGPSLGSWQRLEACRILMNDNPHCTLRPEWFGEHFKRPVEFHVTDDDGDLDLRSVRTDGSECIRCVLL